MLQDLKINGKTSKNGSIIITWTDWDISEIISSYLTKKKKKRNGRTKDQKIECTSEHKAETTVSL